jgi:hypothetical protein
VQNERPGEVAAELVAVAVGLAAELEVSVYETLLTSEWAG